MLFIYAYGRTWGETSVKKKARIQPLDPQLRDFGGRHLLRAAEQRSRRILGAFSSWVANNPRVARCDALRERLIADLSPAERESVRAAHVDLMILPQAADGARRGRSRRGLGPEGFDPELSTRSDLLPPRTVPSARKMACPPRLSHGTLPLLGQLCPITTTPC